MLSFVVIQNYMTIRCVSFLCAGMTVHVGCYIDVAEDSFGISDAVFVE